MKHYLLKFHKRTQSNQYDDNTERCSIEYFFEAGEEVKLYTDTPPEIFTELHKVFFVDIRNDREYMIMREDIANFSYELIPSEQLWIQV